MIKPPEAEIDTGFQLPAPDKWSPSPAIPTATIPDLILCERIDKGFLENLQ